METITLLSDEKTGADEWKAFEATHPDQVDFLRGCHDVYVHYTPLIENPDNGITVTDVSDLADEQLFGGNGTPIGNWGAEYYKKLMGLD